MILNHKCSRSVDQFYKINVLWLPLLKSSLINCVVSFSEAVHQKCRSCPKQIRVKRKWQILASQNLPRLEGALFQGLVAWRIIFFYFQNHFLKIHTRGIPKMSDFYVFSHFWPRKWLLKLKKRVLTPSFSHLTFSSQMGTLSSPTQLKVIQVFKSAFPSLPSVRRAPSQSLSTQNCASSGDCGPGRKYFSSWHIGNVSLWYVDETFLDRLQMFFCQSEEVSVIDDRSIFSLLDEIFHKLLLLFREQHLAGNESICQHRES